MAKSKKACHFKRSEKPLSNWK